MNRPLELLHGTVLSGARKNLEASFDPPEMFYMASGVYDITLRP